MQYSLGCLLLSVAILTPSVSAAQSGSKDAVRGDRQLKDYFRSEVERLAANSAAAARSAGAWQKNRAEMRRQLFDMYGLDPLPERTDLQATVTGSVERDGIVVEKLHFQSIPGLYVTANLYRPKEVTKQLPTVLYLCGHGAAKKRKVSFGNKCTYSHHGCWFAKNGYVCLTIDTLQLGEIEGIHHGTKRFDRWWWMCRGYTPAGVEAWNSIRALDYLETRPEVDRERIGATGRSGGGAYSWSILGLDDRIKAAVPVAGVIDLQTLVVDGVIEGHCDCMFFNNTYQWDYPQFAALAAPRPVLLANTDKDRIFPLDGVLRIHDYMRRVYDFSKASDRFGLQISEGPHKDIPELQVAAFRWLNRFLKNEDGPIEPAAKLFAQEELKVFEELPTDEINTRIDEVFVAKAEQLNPSKTSDEWNAQRDHWLTQLREKCFRAWPDATDELPPLEARTISNSTHDGVQLQAIEFVSQSGVKLHLWVAQLENAAPVDRVSLKILDPTSWEEFLADMKTAFPKAFPEDAPAVKRIDGQSTFITLRDRLKKDTHPVAYCALRGIGLTAWDTSGRKGVETRRRFLLLGQTLDGMQVWDIRRASQALRRLDGFRDASLNFEATGPMGGNALYASLFEPNVDRLDLHELPTTHRQGPYYLNVLRVTDMPQTLAMAAERAEVHLHEKAGSSGDSGDGSSFWQFALQTRQQLGWPAERLQIHRESVD